MANVQLIAQPRRANIEHRTNWLRRRGFKLLAGDGGYWLSNGAVCAWMRDAAAAVRAVQAGWPGLPGVGK